MTVRKRDVSKFYINLCLYFNCVLESTLQSDPSILFYEDPCLLCWKRIRIYEFLGFCMK